jgi:hypothetical protein
MALLVGSPPPPPPSNPPPKKRRSTASQNSRAAAAIPTVQSVDDTYTSATTTSPNTKEDSPSAKSGSPSGSPNMKGGLSVVERRRQAALAIYESERLVLDPPEDGTVNDDRFAAAAVKNDYFEEAGELNTSAATNQEEKASPRKVQPMQAAPSPMSVKTEPHSNQQAQHTFAPGDDEKSSRSTPSKARKQRPKTPERIRRALTPDRRRSKTPESRRASAQGTQQQTKDDSPDNKNKRGFFRKMFGGKKKDRSYDDSSEATKTVSSDTVNMKKKSSRGRDVVRKTASSGSSKDYANTSGDETNSFNDVDRDRPEVFFANDEISTLTNPTLETNRGREPMDRVDSGENSEPKGHYWDHFNGSEEDTIEEDGTPTIDPFTEPFFREEPDGASPQTRTNPNKKADLRINVPEVHDPVGDSPLNSRPNKKVVATSARRVQDPSPRGYTTPSFGNDPHKDPLGESPLHKNQRGPTALLDGSPYAADPPLYRGAGFATDNKSEDPEEKKDDDVCEAGALKTVPPPPPPPPPPRTRVPLSPRGPRSQGLQIASPNSDSVSSKQIASPTSDNVPSKDTINMSAVRKPNENSSLGSIMSAESSTSVQDREVTDDSLPTIDDSVEDEEQGVEEAPSGESLLTISSAARMNAEAVAYLHTLNGEPSPRHAWHQPEFSDDEASPANALQKSIANKQATKTTKPSSASNQFFTAEDEDGPKLFSAYSGKFKGRKLLKDGSSPKSMLELPPTMGDFPSGHSPRTAHASAKWQKIGPLNRDVRIKNDSVLMGISLLRQQREDDIASGTATRVVLVKTPKVPVVQSYFSPLHDPEPKDPIQRAGRRLLSKAAIPIQASARRYLAQRQAVDRMWALIEIQSYLRRFKSQASLLCYRHSSTKIQAVFRGSRCRAVLRDQQVAATQIQKIIRGFLAAASTYDAVYCIILIQAKARGQFVRKTISDQANSSRSIQSAYRGFKVRSGDRKLASASTKVQALWRSYSARMVYQFVVVDIIIVQSTARSWLASRRANAVHFEKRNNSAAKIQAMWRGFQGYTDYIFALVDVLVVQRTARQWLAKQNVLKLRKEIATLKVQTQWRRYSAQMHMLYDLVHIIMIQSLMRKKLAQPKILERRSQIDATSAAAVKVQCAWRGFWNFSHYVIMQYEVSRLQAIVRGRIARQSFSMHLGCCIMIQSVARRYLAVKRFVVLRKSGVLVNAAASAMRERRAAEQIQFWWGVVLDCRIEKYAALVIERFFLSVKEEVDREIRRVERKKHGKTEKSRRKKKEADDKLLERVWLNTVDENHVDVFGYSPSESVMSRSQSESRIRHSSSNSSSPTSKRSSSSKRGGERGSLNASPHSSSSKRTSDKGNFRHRASSPTMNLVMRHEYTDKVGGLTAPPTDSLDFSASEDGSEVSGMTSQSLTARQNAPSSRSKLTRPQLTEDLSLEEAYLDAEVRREKEKKKSTEKYLKMYGIKTAPSHASRKNRFFAEGAESPSQSSKTSRKSLSSLPSARSQASPRTPVEPPGHSRAARKIMKNESPRYGKMNSHPDYKGVSSGSSKDNHHEEYTGEEFGLI